MISVYYYWVLINAVSCLIAAGAIFWRNRRQAVGILLGMAMLLMAIWLVGFAQYFHPWNERSALRWSMVTLTAGMLSPVPFFYGIVVLRNRTQQMRWWMVAAGVSSAVALAILWAGLAVEGVRAQPFMDHYVRYNRTWYPVVVLQILFWQCVSGWLLIREAWHTTGYKRTQAIYFSVTWLVIFLTANLIIVPLEYDIHIPPFGFFILPFNLALLAYVTMRARLADFNVVIVRVFSYTLMLLTVALLGGLLITGLDKLAPNFMNHQQVLFMLAVTVGVGVIVTFTLPRFLSQAERMMQERFLGGRLGYQDVLAGLVKELSRTSSMDQMLETVANTIHSNMQVSRVLVFLQDPLTGEFRLQAQIGLNPEALTDGMTLPDHSPSVRWLREHKDALVQDEVARVLPPSVWGGLAKEFDHFGVSLYVPMLLEEKLVGVIALGEKLNREMFYVSDLRLLSTLATEVALGVRYRRMEEQVVRNNKLVGLGTIAAGLAHEIRNPLASIRTFAQLLPTKTDDPEFKGEFSKMVVQDVDRITKVIQSMLSFARPGTVNFANHSATDLVEEALTLIQPRLKSKNIAVIRLFHERPVLRVDKPQIIQVLINLLNNAIDALSSGGQIRITTGVHRVEEAKGQSGQRFGVVEIADNGSGISAAVRGRLFDPFFTTKKDGTGLGLSISQKIMRDHNGLITVSSIEGHGTAFQVHLPLA